MFCIMYNITCTLMILLISKSMITVNIILHALDSEVTIPSCRMIVMGSVVNSIADTVAMCVYVQG